MMIKPKKCPILVAGYLASEYQDTESTECNGCSCAWWVDQVYSTENIRQEGMCAIVALALKNAEGKIVV